MIGRVHALEGGGVAGSVGAEAGGSPVHVGEEVGGLHRGDDAELGEAVEVGWEQDLGVFDSETFTALAHDIVCAGTTNNYAILVGLILTIVGLGDLFGSGEGVEGHCVGLVADGVEAKLEAGGAAGSGHLVEGVLVIACDAGVGGVVGVGFGEGGGAGAEGAVHEGFELADVEEWIVGGMAGSALFEDGDGEVEVEPLGYAEVEFIGVFEGEEDLEVVPVGEVLGAGDAVGKGVGDGNVEGSVAVVERRRRNFGGEQGDGGAFANDASGCSGYVVIDLAAGRVGGR